MSTAAEVLRIGPADHGRRMTLQEFLDAEEEEGYVYELARGVLEVSVIAGFPQRFMVWFLLGLIRDYERDHPGRIVYAGGGAEFRLWIPELASGRHPDVGVATNDAQPDLVQGGPRPTFCIEIVSSGKEAHDRDYVAKREEYLAYGLMEYWIVDHIARIVTVLVRDVEAWAETVFDRDDQSATGRVLSGFAVPLSELWAAAERAGEASETDENH